VYFSTFLAAVFLYPKVGRILNADLSETETFLDDLDSVISRFYYCNRNRYTSRGDRTVLCQQ